MDKFIKEIALKAEDILNSAVCKCEKNTNPTTAALNAEFALGKYFALMDIVKAYDMELYISVVESTKKSRNKLTKIINNINENWIYKPNTPEREKCDCDYLADWIIQQGYKPKTSIENLVRMVLMCYDKPMNFGIYDDWGNHYSLKGCINYIKDAGGLGFFDIKLP